MLNNYGLDYDTGWYMAHDPQTQNASTEMGICLMCGELFPVAELECNEGMCLACFYASLEPDPDDGDPDEGMDFSFDEPKNEKDGEANAGER